VGVLFGREGVCVASGGGIKRKFLGRGYPKRGVTRGTVGAREIVWGLLALFMHTKFKVSSFSYSGDTSAITDRITE